MNKLILLAGLFFVSAITFQFRHEISQSFDGLTDSGRRAKLSSDKLMYETFSGGKRYSGPESSNEAIALKKEPDKPVVYILYGAALLFLFGGMMKVPEANQGDKSHTNLAE